ncbi:DODA-type extradiol aromatic ring-opening family dioxygenase [Paenibacillus odorifer]|uniref:DODA-type extradiol aromatic ring-opening family dioxygenase n=1 Tax=Paenibacillus odorifer TaxID=189426 RepID=UPI00096EB732|nr:class III extradiol ring-cleavage dioxygenase [Paenibacillus odorifer]OMD81560.1 dioxygenase [Paenibacillus odorifer]
MIPSYFIAHGAPSLVLDNNAYTKFLGELAERNVKPKAIVVFSAHFEEHTQSVGVMETFDTIYDFYGFPDEMYRMTYPAKGDNEVAQQIMSLFHKNGIVSKFNTERGLDHGAWAILKLIYPNADIPVVSLSVNRELSNEQQYLMGKALSELREQDIMIIGSGGTVHNLRSVKWGMENVEKWAETFDDWLQHRVEAWDTESLFNYQELAPYGVDAVPTSEHFIPLIIAMGAGDKGKEAKLLHRSYQYGNLSLSCWEFN